MTGFDDPFMIVDVDCRREGELLKTLGINRIVRTPTNQGTATAIRMWFHQWSAETIIRTADLMAIAKAYRGA